MAQPPTGAVTFLFSDIQGSTKLWEQHREAMDVALKRHDELMRQAMDGHQGYVFKTVGDAFCVAFPSAAEAVAASVQAQQSLGEEDWGQTPIKVRMGLHTGEAHERGGDYFGPTLNRTARLMSIGHGGQVLLSQATQDLLSDVLTEGLSLQDLGFHRLKDLAQPEHVYQLLHPALAQQFPDLNSLSFLANNLPAQTTSFIGRESDIEQVTKLLEKSRLVTLTGIGGTGKTRLSLQVAADRIEHYADGVWFVELAPVSQPSLVVNAISDMLDVADEAGKTMLDSLKGWLKHKHLLLVLDNCEHVLKACAQAAAELLKACPKLRILASSREALDIGGEALWAVTPLSVPKGLPTVERLLESDAIRLFVERAQAVKPLFQLTQDNAQAVSTICHRLDGIPLALELAAARLQMITAHKLAEMLDDRFRYLTGGKREALAHHQTLRATMDWSYDLLEDAEKGLLNRLSVFQGGFVMEAAEGVCAGEGLDELEVLDTLSQLVQKSLVEVGEAARYRLLETVREYGAEKLQAVGETERLLTAHLNYFVELAETAEPELMSAEQARWLQRLHLDHDNFRGALGWAMQAKRWEAAQRMCGALGRFWYMQGHMSEGRAWLGQALQVREGVDLTAQAKALRWAGGLATTQGDFDEARRLLEESLVLFRKLGDTQGIAGALNTLGIVARRQGDLTGARVLYEEALALCRRLGDTQGIARVLNNLGSVASLQGDLAGACVLYEEALAFLRELGDTQGMAGALTNLGEIALSEGRVEAARQQLAESLRLSQEIGDKVVMNFALAVMASVIYKEGFVVNAARLQGACARWRKELGAPLGTLEQKLYDETQVALQDEMGGAAYLEACEAGKKMSLEGAVELALKRPGA